MPAERRAVHQGDIVADLAVVGDMGADHQEAVGADLGLHVAARGAGIDGDVLSDDGLGADR